MRRIQNDGKVHTKLIRLFGNVTEIKQKMQGGQLSFPGYQKKKICLSRLSLT